MKNNSTLRFNLTQTRSGLFFSPANDAANEIIPRGRKCLKSFELCRAIDAGKLIELNLSPYLGNSFWVTLKKSELENI